MTENWCLEHFYVF